MADTITSPAAKRVEHPVVFGLAGASVVATALLTGDKLAFACVPTEGENLGDVYPNAALVVVATASATAAASDAHVILFDQTMKNGKRLIMAAGGKATLGDAKVAAASSSEDDVRVEGAAAAATIAGEYKEGEVPAALTHVPTAHAALCTAGVTAVREGAVEELDLPRGLVAEGMLFHEPRTLGKETTKERDGTAKACLPFSPFFSVLLVEAAGGAALARAATGLPRTLDGVVVEKGAPVAIPAAEILAMDPSAASYATATGGEVKLAFTSVVAAKAALARYGVA
jgi:hypothetical protein